MTETVHENIRFILDAHLGKLARSLRLIGFYSFYHQDITDDEIISQAFEENLIILTRDKELLRNRRVIKGYRVLSQYPVEQLREVITKFGLWNNINPFARCMECNSLLEVVPKEEVLELLPLKTRKYFDLFRRCTGCSKIYWEGSHYQSMKKFIESLIKDVN